MKTVSMIALLALAGVASASPIITATAEPLTSGGYSDRVATVYSCLGSPYSAFPAASGSLGFDDYTSTISGDADTMTSFKFVGGVAAVGGSLKIDIYSLSAVLVNSFNVTLPSAGNFVWTIGLGTGVDIPASGIIQISTVGASTGQWFLRPGAPTIGSTSQTYGGFQSGATRFNQAMELIVPSTGTLGLVGLGGLVAGRRRRA
jgi:hypothetical protein